ncbi:uncharacterized protein LOC123541769 [Mercenaria mercenaria]|uniref:uncharacterized protein LOC123541769 n=1 Tax=Mercenaria mercenaria TaxID=6596 RepID=UPI00234EA6A8|nr:uncharacterized protein LOC123541769 [Mercenaria mercenaria]
MFNKILRLTAVTLVTILWISISVDACFPSKYWISCLIDSCKLGGRCPGDPTAKCKMEKTDCNGCKPRWYSKNGEKANCGVKRDLKLCPGGEPVVHCKVDSCKWPCSHPDFKRAKCRQSYCGECAAEYLLKGKWVKCPVSSTGQKDHSEKLPIDTVVGDSCLKVHCPIDVCIGQRCPKVPRAVCRPNGCNTCKPAWFVGNRPVDCKTGKLVDDKPVVSPKLPPWQRTCANGVPLTKCDMKVCEKKICRNFPNAKCRPDGCGGCKDTWYVDNKLVDCLSDECPPKVPIVKCVDDPCKYFGHYCPAAECRASQCGKCEAKFFANGQEIDCAMPPKECPMGIQPINCPWYTCPANICPSNRRLMCRIDPCGRTCKYEFIDIYNGEPMLCRVFDGDGRRQRNRNGNVRQNEVAGNNIGNPPLLGDIAPAGPSTFGLGLPRNVDIAKGGSHDSFVGDTNLNPTAGSFSSGSSDGFNVQPVFKKPAPAITDPDLLSLLRSFPHEMANIPSAMIQTALKKNKGMTKMSKPLIQESVPVKSQIVDQGKPILVKSKPKSVPNNKATRPKNGQSMKTFFSVGDNVVDNQLLDLALKDSTLSGLNIAQPLSRPSTNKETLIIPPLKETKKQQKKPKVAAASAVPAGKPLNIDSQTVLSAIQDKPPRKEESKKLGVKVSQPKNIAKGVPISIGLFSLWSMS